MGGILGLLVGPVFDIIKRFIPDPQQQAQMQMELLKMQQDEQFKELDAQLQMAQGQMQTNTAEASNSNVFVAGWRPWIGWICGCAFGANLIVFPLITTIAASFGKSVAFPPMDMNMIVTVLGGMLGIGGMHTIEKIKGVA